MNMCLKQKSFLMKLQINSLREPLDLLETKNMCICICYRALNFLLRSQKISYMLSIISSLKGSNTNAEQTNKFVN